MSPVDRASARPSPWWIVAIAVACGLSLAVFVASVIHQREVDRPVGEGELFVVEAAHAAAEIAAASANGTPEDDAVRAIRNDLEIEAVSVVDEGTTVSASTSPSLTGTSLDSPLLGYAHVSGLFAAAATATNQPIVVDGIEEWAPGATLYEVVYPIDAGRSLLLHYDISELLARRARATGVSPRTIALVAIALGFLAAAVVLAIGRIRAGNRFASMAREAELLEAHNAQLEDRNARLDEARAAAEHALALAEEKNRIRAEFVLMINHEIRTPLTSVVTGARLLAEEDLQQDTRREILTTMLADGERLETLIAQILAVARIENRGLNSVVSDIPMADVWDTVIASLPPGVDRLAPTGGVETVVNTDPETLSQLVRSLVDNAFTHGARRVEISLADDLGDAPAFVTGPVSGPGVFVRVADDGPGIDPAFLPRAFEKFEKDSFSSGTGLGLYVARLMAEAIGSTVAVHTSPSGTTMSILIPAAGASIAAEVTA